MKKRRCDVCKEGLAIYFEPNNSVPVEFKPEAVIKGVYFCEQCFKKYRKGMK
jgi:uncharacterized protein with PIN domain